MLPLQKFFLILIISYKFSVILNNPQSSIHTLEVQIPSAEGTCFIRTFQNDTDGVSKLVCYMFASHHCQEALAVAKGHKDSTSGKSDSAPTEVASPDLTRNTSAWEVRGLSFLVCKQKDWP